MCSQNSLIDFIRATLMASYSSIVLWLGNKYLKIIFFNEFSKKLSISVEKTTHNLALCRGWARMCGPQPLQGEGSLPMLLQQAAEVPSYRIGVAQEPEG